MSNPMLENEKALDYIQEAIVESHLGSNVLQMSLDEAKEIARISITAYNEWFEAKELSS